MENRENNAFLELISGGEGNIASGRASSVNGGQNRIADGEWDWVAGSLWQDK